MGCDRCGRRVQTPQMSLFTANYLCFNCAADERRLNRYAEAVQAHVRAREEENLLFAGIGLTTAERVLLDRLRRERTSEYALAALAALPAPHGPALPCDMGAAFRWWGGDHLISTQACLGGRVIAGMGSAVPAAAMIRLIGSRVPAVTLDGWEMERLCAQTEVAPDGVVQVGVGIPIRRDELQRLMALCAQPPRLPQILSMGRHVIARVERQERLEIRVVAQLACQGHIRLPVMLWRDLRAGHHTPGLARRQIAGVVELHPDDGAPIRLTEGEIERIALLVS